MRSFEEEYKKYELDSRIREDESGKYVVHSYEIILNSMKQIERRALVSTFGLDAIQAGYKQVFAPVVLPSVRIADLRGEIPLTAVYFFLEKSLVD